MNTTDPTTDTSAEPGPDNSHDTSDSPGPAYQPPKRLVRTRDDQMIAGVCGGLARYLGVDPTLVRVIAVIAPVFAFPATIVGYLLAWAIMPSA
jgi:phage shock protein PspC (stress-responsive transcriptional regulator)